MADLIRARATINMRKLAAGGEALVDPSNPYIALCLKKGLLVPLDAPPVVEAEAETDDRAPDIEADEGDADDEDESEHPEAADLG